MTLLLLPAGSAVPLGPVWSVLCGAWAAGHWRWDGEVLLALVVSVFIAEVLWSSWRVHLVEARWDTYLEELPLAAAGDALPRPPYTTPWSPLGRALRRWGQVRRWMRESLPAERKGALLALPMLPPLILLLSALVGWQTLLLSLAALALTAIEWLVARREHPHTALQAALEIGLAWLVGHIVFAPLTAPSFTLACCFALAYQGALNVQRSDDGAREHRIWSLSLLYGGQIAAAIAILICRHPTSALAATAIGLLLAPQLLLLTELHTQNDALSYLRRSAPFVMLAMPLAAWAI